MFTKNQALVATGILLSISFFSCNESSYEKQGMSAAAPTESISSESESDTARTVIKTADIALSVDRVEDQILSLQQTVSALKGHVIHYELHNQTESEKEVEHSLDSSYVIRSIHPNGFVKVKVPVESADTFIQYILHQDGRIENFLLDEEDVTEDLREKKELVQVDDVAGTAAPKKQTLARDAYQTDRRETRIHRKADYSKLAYRTKYLWFDIRLEGKKYTDKEMIATAKEAQRPFYVGAVNALGKGWEVFSLFIIGLLHLWPFLLISILALIVFRKKLFPAHKSI
ncbi:MAG: hypothetical protein JNJ58_09190 [Chitinophagaceae bacterium]|nr:hypothetical protein [Chitinophagaceae bacterium]